VGVGVAGVGVRGPAVGKYPPDSQPLGAEQKSLINAGGGPEIVARVAEQRDTPEGGDEMMYELKSDRFSIVGDQAAIVTLSAYRGEPTPGAARLPVDVRRAVLRTRATEDAAARDLGALVLEDEGRDGDAVAGDSVHSSRVAPGGMGAVAGEYTVVVDFAVDDTVVTGAHLPVRFTPEGDVPARFTGKITERLDRGSLVLSVELDVGRKGSYDIRGNLYDSGGEPIGHASSRGHLDLGLRRLDLRFFGLMFHEKGRKGPYVFRQLRGTMLEGNLQVPMHLENYETKAYRIEDFTSATWENMKRGKPPTR
jgi:hypothetical protein